MYYKLPKTNFDKGLFTFYREQAEFEEKLAKKANQIRQEKYGYPKSERETTQQQKKKKKKIKNHHFSTEPKAENKYKSQSYLLSSLASEQSDKIPKIKANQDDKINATSHRQSVKLSDFQPMILEHKRKQDHINLLKTKKYKRSKQNKLISNFQNITTDQMQQRRNRLDFTQQIQKFLLSKKEYLVKLRSVSPKKQSTIHFAQVTSRDSISKQSKSRARKDSYLKEKEKVSQKHLIISSLLPDLLRSQQIKALKVNQQQQKFVKYQHQTHYLTQNQKSSRNPYQRLKIKISSMEDECMEYEN